MNLNFALATGLFVALVFAGCKANVKHEFQPGYFYVDATEVDQTFEALRMAMTRLDVEFTGHDAEEGEIFLASFWSPGDTTVACRRHDGDSVAVILTPSENATQEWRPSLFYEPDNFVTIFAEELEKKGLVLSIVETRELK